MLTLMGEINPPENVEEWSEDSGDLEFMQQGGKINKKQQSTPGVPLWTWYQWLACFVTLR